MGKREKKVGVNYISLDAETPSMIDMVLKKGDYHKNTTAWLIINQSLGTNEDHIIKPMHHPVIAFKAQITEVELYHLMDNLVKYNPEYFNYQLWKDYEILRIDKIVDHYTATVYTKNDRTNKPATVEELIQKQPVKVTVNEKVNEIVTVNEKVNEIVTVYEKVNSNSNSNSKGSEGKREGSEGKREGSEGNRENPFGNREGSDGSDLERQVLSKDMFSDEMLELVKSKKDDGFSKWYLSNLVDTSIPIQARDVEGAFMHYTSKVKDQPKFIGVDDLQPLLIN